MQSFEFKTIFWANDFREFYVCHARIRIREKYVRKVNCTLIRANICRNTQNLWARLYLSRYITGKLFIKHLAECLVWTPQVQWHVTLTSGSQPENWIMWCSIDGCHFTFCIFCTFCSISRWTSSSFSVTTSDASPKIEIKFQKFW